MSEKRKYRTFTPEQKAEIVLAGLRGDRTVRDICREYEIAETLSTTSGGAAVARRAPAAGQPRRLLGTGGGGIASSPGPPARTTGRIVLSSKALLERRPDRGSQRRCSTPAAKDTEQPVQHHIAFGTLTPDAVLQLQQAIGNRAVRRLLPRPTRSSGHASRLPDDLRLGIEALSGLPMDDVAVHYDSAEPSRVGAFACTQGTVIHVRPGRAGDLPHEAWHVVQQKQGRVRPSLTLGGLRVNDDPALEHEADRMGDRATRLGSRSSPEPRASTLALEPGAPSATGDVVQMNGWGSTVWEFIRAAAKVKSLESVVTLIQALTSTVTYFNAGDPTATAAVGIGTAAFLALTQLWTAWKEYKSDEAQGSEERRQVKGKFAQALANALGVVVAIITASAGAVAASVFVSMIWSVVVTNLGEVFINAWAAVGGLRDKEALFRA